MKRSSWAWALTIAVCLFIGDAGAQGLRQPFSVQPTGFDYYRYWQEEPASPSDQPVDADSDVPEAPPTTTDEAPDERPAEAPAEAPAEDSGADPVFRNVATLLWGLTGLDHEPPQQMIAALKPLTAETERWRFTARELTALYEIKAGRKAAALEIFKKLAADQGAPSALRVRASEMVAVMSGS